MINIKSEIRKLYKKLVGFKVSKLKKSNNKKLKRARRNRHGFPRGMGAPEQEN